MKNIEKLKSDINFLILDRNKELYGKKFCDLCYEKIRRYSMERHMLQKPHKHVLDSFINNNEELSDDEIILKYLALADFYYLKFY